MRYWTLSNIPLFLLAIPVLGLLLTSSIELFSFTAISELGASTSAPMYTSLAVPQFVLAVLAFLTYHVQIITRLSSGYPLQYMWLAEKMYSKDVTAKYTVRFFVMYALIQAGLFASFLPPA